MNKLIDNAPLNNTPLSKTIGFTNALCPVDVIVPMTAPFKQCCVCGATQGPFSRVIGSDIDEVVCMKHVKEYLFIPGDD